MIGFGYRLFRPTTDARVLLEKVSPQGRYRVAGDGFDGDGMMASVCVRNDGFPLRSTHPTRTVTLNVMTEDFELLSEVTRIEVMAVNLSIRERKRLKAQFGGRRWRKLKGEGRVRFPNGEIRQAELHWYEAHGIGRRKMKVKRVLD